VETFCNYVGGGGDAGSGGGGGKDVYDDDDMMTSVPTYVYAKDTKKIFFSIMLGTC